MMMLAAKCSIEIDPMVPAFTSLVVTILKIAIPLILIILGMVDLAKAVMSNDEKTMKEAQGKLIKRIIYAVLVFFVVAIVQLVFGMLAKAGGADKASMSACIDCFINSDSDFCSQ